MKTYVNCIRVSVVRDDRVPSNNRHMYVKINLQFGIVEHDALCDENVTVRDLLFDLERLEFLKYQQGVEFLCSLHYRKKKKI